MQEDERKKYAPEDMDTTGENVQDAGIRQEREFAGDTEDAGDFDDFRVDTGGIFEEDEEEEELFASLNESLMRQVAQELDGGEDTVEDADGGASEKKKMGKLKKSLLIAGSVFLVLLLGTAFLVGTKPGRKVVYGFVAKYISIHVNHGEMKHVILAILPLDPGSPGQGPGGGTTVSPQVTPVPPDAEEVRKEDYVKNILIFGIDQGNMDTVHSGSLNTDTIMIATLNTKDKTVKITSILRDMYVELDDGVGRKLNSIYAVGRRDGQGPELLMHTIEDYYKIDLMGYAYVKLEAFEQVVDILGGVSIELGSKEANYLNTTNYITNPKNRNLKAGVNYMNGNQVAGYCRIRKVETLGGAANDYGRTLRQRRVLQAIFQKYKSQNVFNLFSVTEKCLAKITTDLTAEQISELLEMFVECGISSMESYRLPINDSFYDSAKKGYNGVTYGLVVNDIEANVLYLYEHLYADTPEEAKDNYDALKR